MTDASFRGFLVFAGISLEAACLLRIKGCPRVMKQLHPFRQARLRSGIRITLPSSILRRSTIAKNRNTYAKRQRDADKKAKAEAKQARRLGRRLTGGASPPAPPKETKPDTPDTPDAAV
jgi:hypothetical protein